MSKDNLNQHLVSNIPNIQEFRDFVKQINKMSKESKSIWRLGIRYRQPKEGHKYGYGGNLRCENANAFSVYIHDRRPYGDQPGNQYRTELWQENYKLEEENEKLKEELAFYKNPYNEWRVSEIEDEIFEDKQKIVKRFIDCDNDLELLRNIELQNKYNQLMEALAYHEEKND